MRRMKADGRIISPTRRPRSHRPLSGPSERARSTFVLKALALAGILGWILYIGTFEWKGRVKRASVSNGSASSWKPSPSGSKGPRRFDLRSRFRQLNMMGFENDAGEEGQWKTCRTYKEKDLIAHKKKGERGHDPYLQMLKPTPGAAWEFSMAEDQDAEWLGLHQWDDRYEYGSAEADRRVKKLGYCRVHMPSVPRTGSTWFRAMFETATGQPTFSMWAEGGTIKPKYQAFSSDDVCGASLDNMEGNLRSKRVSPCRNLRYVAFSSDDPCGASPDQMEGRLTSKEKFPCRHVRPPNATSPILYKSHTPFFPSYNKPSLMPEETCMLMLLVRNPIDNQDAWMRYMAGKGQILREYLPVWQGHISHWVASAGDIPIYVFRYEDMLYRAEEVLRRILETLPGGWNWSEESIAEAMRLYGPKKPFSEKCGAGFKAASVAEVNMVRTHYGSFLRHFGYRFTPIEENP